jgi:hypothetical protein
MQDRVDLSLVSTHHFIQGQISCCNAILMGRNACFVASFFKARIDSSPPRGSMASLIQHRWSSATDTRPCFLSLGTPIIGCHMERVRIGITEFANMAQCSDRLISHKTFMKIRTAFPHADLVDVTFLMNVASLRRAKRRSLFSRMLPIWWPMPSKS